MVPAISNNLYPVSAVLAGGAILMGYMAWCAHRGTLSPQIVTLMSTTASKGLSPLKVGFFFFGCVFAMTMISQQKLPEAIGFGLLAGVLAYWVRSREISSDE